MTSHGRENRRIWRRTLFLLGISLLLWPWEGLRPLSQGFILGVLTSLLYCWNLFHTTWRVTEAAVQGGGRPTGSGMLWRMVLVLAAMYLVHRRPDAFSFIAFLLGLFTVQALYVLQTLASLFCKRSSTTARRKG